MTDILLVVEVGLFLITCCLLVACFLLNRASGISLKEGKKIIEEMKTLQKGIDQSIIELERLEKSDGN